MAESESVGDAATGTSMPSDEMLYNRCKLPTNVVSSPLFAVVKVFVSPVAKPTLPGKPTKSGPPSYADVASINSDVAKWIVSAAFMAVVSLRDKMVVVGNPRFRAITARLRT